MALSSIDEVVAALASPSTQIFYLNKPDTVTQPTTGGWTSHYRLPGFPRLGFSGLPVSVLTRTSLGAIGFRPAAAGKELRLAKLSFSAQAAGTNVILVDRIAQIQNLAVTTAGTQNVTGFDMDTLVIDADRIGNEDYSNLMWFVEVYGTVAAARTASVQVTDTDGNVSVITVSIPASAPLGRMYPLQLPPSGGTARYIRRIDSLTMSSTTTGGPIGITVFKPIMDVAMPSIYERMESDWTATGLPIIPNTAALSLISMSSNTPTAKFVGTLVLVEVDA